VDPADHATLVAMDRGFRSGERHFDRREIRLLDRSGGQHWMLMSAAARRDPAGDYDGVVALFLDVEEQRAAEESRRDLGAQLVLAAEVERRRLAEDLHDGPVQQLSALALRLGVLAMQSDDTQVRTRAAEAEEVVRSTVTGLRTLMFELVPPDLEGHGLARAIKGAAEVVLTGQQVAIDVHDSVAAKPDVAIQTVAFRIAQEALSNVRNHAHASEVVVDLRDDEGGIRLEISDNGQGVAAARLAESHPGHLGLASVRRRAQEVGGWCEVESEVGLGTTVRAWLPVVP
jgi:signal transduction histidine kinase